MEKAVEGGIFLGEPRISFSSPFCLFYQVAFLRGRGNFSCLRKSNREWFFMNFHGLFFEQEEFIMALEKKFYNIEEMSELLGKSIASIYGHLARKQFDAVPPPMKLGRRLAWLVSGVDEWVDMKIREVEREQAKYMEKMSSGVRRRGRPRKKLSRN